ncbi:MAG: signal peptidase I, partial [Slackia sp.]|nr:signal peptidase I [Slackia sp.]
MISRIWNIVLTLLLVAAAALAIAFAGVRLVGLTPYAVLSGSMEPQYPVGSMIYVKSADPATVQVGQAITFEAGADKLITHQVYDIDPEQRLFYTQGIANVNSAGEISHDAAPTSWDALVGVPVACVPYLGYVNDWITHAPGIYVMVALVAVIMAITIVLELRHMSVEKRRAEERERMERYRHQDAQRRSNAYAAYAPGQQMPGVEQGVPQAGVAPRTYGAQAYGAVNPSGSPSAYESGYVAVPGVAPRVSSRGVQGADPAYSQQAVSGASQYRAPHIPSYDEVSAQQPASAYVPVVP